MKIYIVGGAVRDVILGIEPKDIDFCVVGSSVDEMLSLGFLSIEATSFPVFHDNEGQEYALARTEKKTGNGYHGFDIVYDSSITIEDDLFRRDLTANSMAVAEENWESFKITKCESLLIDPYNGLKSIMDKKIKHTSKHFIDDPVRAIRAVRLANRYSFDICKSTKKLIIQMVENEELSHLTPERVWLEIEKVLSTSTNIAGFFKVLEELNILDCIIPKYNSEELFIDYNDLNSYNESGINSIEMAFLALINTNSYNHIEFLVKSLKIPHTFLNVFKSYTLIQEFTYEQTKDPEIVMKCLNDLNIYVDKKYNDFKIAYNFFVFIEKRFEKQCYFLKNCFIITQNIRFDCLSKEEQETLKGSEIGVAINRLKENQILKSLENDYQN